MQKRAFFFRALVLVVAVGLVALRFFHLGIVPFIADEPIFQQWAMEFIEGGKMRWVGMGGSSIPVSYGAGATWIYSIPHLLWSHPYGFVFFHTAIFSSAFLFFYLAARKAFGPSAAAVSLLLAASSPFLFFFSRHAWDTTFFVPFTAIMLYAYASLESRSKADTWRPDWQGVWPFLVMVFFTALAINIQLACGPFVLALSLGMLLWVWRHERKNGAAWAAILLSGLAIALLCVPYLLASMEIHRAHAEIFAKPKLARWGSGLHFWWNILYSLFGLSVWKAKVFFEPVYGTFEAYVGPMAKVFYLDPFGWLLKPLVFLSLLSPWALRGRATLLHWLAAFGFVTVLLVFQYLNVPVQPHYFLSLWWVPFVGFAALAAGSHGIFRKIIYALGLGTAAVNAIFVVSAFSYLSVNGGTRGMIHGTGLAHTMKTAQAFCGQLRAEGKTEALLDISGVAIGAQPLQYFFQRSEECMGIGVGVSSSPLNSAIAYRLIYPTSSLTDARFLLVAPAN